MLSKYERTRKILKLLGLCKIKCAICNEKNQEEVCFKCMKCESIFCPHCCRDIEKKCLACEEQLSENSFKESSLEKSQMEPVT